MKMQNDLKTNLDLILGDIRVYNQKELNINLWYPRSENNIKYIKVGLMDVRAADDIRISYDFDRDGYVIEQASKFSWPIDDPECDPNWQEVAFVQAWAREEEEK
jgi:hypothetical protein